MCLLCIRLYYLFLQSQLSRQVVVDINTIFPPSYKYYNTFASNLEVLLDITFDPETIGYHSCVDYSSLLEFLKGYIGCV